MKMTLDEVALIDNAIQQLFELVDPKQQTNAASMLDSVYHNCESLELVRRIRQTNRPDSFTLSCAFYRNASDGEKDYCVLADGHVGSHKFADGTVDKDEEEDGPL